MKNDLVKIEEPSKDFGELENCPYCKQKIEKFPTRKSKCPHCKEIILPRTRPTDRKRILIKNSEEKELQRQWDLYNDYKEFQSLRKDKDFLSVVKSLTSQFGEKPSFDDVKWRIFNNYSRDYAMERQWGFFRNNRMYMADFLLKKGKLENALIHYLEVLYLDINGPRNVSIESEQLLNYKEKDFIPSENSSTLYMISNINKIKEDLKFTKEQIKEYFFNVNNSDRPIPQMPISVNDAWNMAENNIT